MPNQSDNTLPLFSGVRHVGSGATADVFTLCIPIVATTATTRVLAQPHSSSPLQGNVAPPTATTGGGGGGGIPPLCARPPRSTAGHLPPPLLSSSSPSLSSSAFLTASTAISAQVTAGDGFYSLPSAGCGGGGGASSVYFLSRVPTAAALAAVVPVAIKLYRDHNHPTPRNQQQQQQHHSFKGGTSSARDGGRNSAATATATTVSPPSASAHELAVLSYMQVCMPEPGAHIVRHLCNIRRSDLLSIPGVATAVAATGGIAISGAHSSSNDDDGSGNHSEGGRGTSVVMPLPPLPPPPSYLSTQLALCALSPGVLMAATAETSCADTHDSNAVTFQDEGEAEAELSPPPPPPCLTAPLRGVTHLSRIAGAPVLSASLFSDGPLPTAQQPNNNKFSGAHIERATTHPALLSSLSLASAHPSLITSSSATAAAVSMAVPVFEYMSGGPLHRFVQSHAAVLLAPAHAAMRTARLADWMGGAAAALRELHAHGILHRDVKPANLLVRLTTDCSTSPTTTTTTTPTTATTTGIDGGGGGGDGLSASGVDGDGSEGQAPGKEMTTMSGVEEAAKGRAQPQQRCLATLFVSERFARASLNRIRRGQAGRVVDGLVGVGRPQDRPTPPVKATNDDDDEAAAASAERRQQQQQMERIAAAVVALCDFGAAEVFPSLQPPTPTANDGGGGGGGVGSRGGCRATAHSSCCSYNSYGTRTTTTTTTTDGNWRVWEKEQDKKACSQADDYGGYASPRRDRARHHCLGQQEQRRAVTVASAHAARATPTATATGKMATAPSAFSASSGLWSGKLQFDNDVNHWRDDEDGFAAATGRGYFPFDSNNVNALCVSGGDAAAGGGGLSRPWSELTGASVGHTDCATAAAAAAVNSKASTASRSAPRLSAMDARFHSRLVPVQATPGFCPPEVGYHWGLCRLCFCTPASDVYSLGVAFFMLLTSPIDSLGEAGAVGLPFHHRAYHHHHNGNDNGKVNNGGSSGTDCRATATALSIVMTTRGDYPTLAELEQQQHEEQHCSVFHTDLGDVSSSNNIYAHQDDISNGDNHDSEGGAGHVHSRTRTESLFSASSLSCQDSTADSKQQQQHEIVYAVGSSDELLSSQESLSSVEPVTVPTAAAVAGGWGEKGRRLLFASYQDPFSMSKGSNEPSRGGSQTTQKVAITTAALTAAISSEGAGQAWEASQRFARMEHRRRQQQQQQQQHQQRECAPDPLCASYTREPCAAAVSVASGHWQRREQRHEDGSDDDDDHVNNKASQDAPRHRSCTLAAASASRSPMRGADLSSCRTRLSLDSSQGEQHHQHQRRRRCLSQYEQRFTSLTTGGDEGVFGCVGHHASHSLPARGGEALPLSDGLVCSQHRHHRNSSSDGSFRDVQDLSNHNHQQHQYRRCDGEDENSGGGGGADDAMARIVAGSVWWSSSRTATTTTATTADGSRWCDFPPPMRQQVADNGSSCKEPGSHQHHSHQQQQEQQQQQRQRRRWQDRVLDTASMRESLRRWAAPPRLLALVDAMMAVDPQRRPSTDAVLAALAAIKCAACFPNNNSGGAAAANHGGFRSGNGGRGATSHRRIYASLTTDFDDDFDDGRDYDGDAGNHESEVSVPGMVWGPAPPDAAEEATAADDPR